MWCIGEGGKVLPHAHYAVRAVSYNTAGMSQQRGWVQKPNGQWIYDPSKPTGPTGIQKAEYVTKSLFQMSLLICLLGFVVLVLWAIVTS